MFIRRGGERFARKQKQSLEEVNTYTKGYSSKINKQKYLPIMKLLIASQKSLSQ